MSLCSPTTNSDDELRLLKEELRRRELAELKAELARREAKDDYSKWLPIHLPEFRWDWLHLRAILSKLQKVTDGEIDRFGCMIPPQHGKTRSISVPYPVWRMIRTPGLRTGVCSHSQRYANKISRWARKLAVKAGAAFGEVNRADEWEMQNGSTFIARGRGASIAGEPLDLLVVDDVFGSRQDADSPVVQEEAYEWYMDDVTPRLQKDAAIVLVNTRWGPGDLYGRIAQSEEAEEWDILRLPAIAEENDPIGRAPGTALCEDRFPLEKLRQKQRVEGVGFESLYQGNPIPRGGTFFERAWFSQPVDVLPAGARLVRYWDLAASRKDSACYTSGVLMARVGQGEEARYYVVDVVRGRWMPAERNDVMLQTAMGDRSRPGFERTWFEEPVFDRDRAAMRAIMAKLAGHAVMPDPVSGAGGKELRAEPLAGASKAGIVRLVAGPWNAAYLTELEGFPRGQWKDQVDSSSGAFNKLARPAALVVDLTA